MKIKIAFITFWIFLLLGGTMSAQQISNINTVQACWQLASGLDSLIFQNLYVGYGKSGSLFVTPMGYVNADGVPVKITEGEIGPCASDAPGGGGADTIIINLEGCRDTIIRIDTTYFISYDTTLIACNLGPCAPGNAICEGDSVYVLTFADCSTARLPIKGGGSSSAAAGGVSDVFNASTPPTPNCATFTGGIWKDSTQCREITYSWVGDCAGGSWVQIDYDSLPQQSLQVDRTYLRGSFISLMAYSPNAFTNVASFNNFSFDYFIDPDDSDPDPESVATWTNIASSANNKITDFQMPQTAMERTVLFRVQATDVCNRIITAYYQEKFAYVLEVKGATDDVNTTINDVRVAFEHLNNIDYKLTGDTTWNIYVFGEHEVGLGNDRAILTADNVGVRMMHGALIYNVGSAGNGSSVFSIEGVTNFRLSSENSEEPSFYSSPQSSKCIEFADCVNAEIYIDNIYVDNDNTAGSGTAIVFNTSAGVRLFIDDVTLRSNGGSSQFGLRVGNFAIDTISITDSDMYSECINTTGQGSALYIRSAGGVGAVHLRNNTFTQKAIPTNSNGVQIFNVGLLHMFDNKFVGINGGSGLNLTGVPVPGTDFKAINNYFENGATNTTSTVRSQTGTHTNAHWFENHIHAPNSNYFQGITVKLDALSGNDTNTYTN